MVAHFGTQSQIQPSLYRIDITRLQRCQGEEVPELELKGLYG